jgi:hypothetical protein
MKPGTVSISLSPVAVGPCVASGRELARVKEDAVAHAERDPTGGAPAAEELERHHHELAEIRQLLEELAVAADEARLAGRRELVDEVVRGALVVESQQLADGAMALDADGGLAEIVSTLERVGRLVEVLRDVRS